MRRTLEPALRAAESGQQPVARGSRHRTPPRLAAAAIAVTLLIPTSAAAQDVTAPALKAAYVFNFVKFTEWPGPLPASDPFVICVFGDSAVGAALERLVAGRQAAGRQMVVSPVADSGPKDNCRVLYVSGSKTSEMSRVVAGLRDAPVLTISDGAGFTDAGGMAQLFFERGQLRFTIKVEAVKRARLQMSSRLLVLARP